MTNPANSGSGFWEPSAWYLAQTIHALAGALIVQDAVMYGWVRWKVLLIFGVAAALKEYGLDLSRFEGDSVKGSTWDFSFYCLGGLTGWLKTIGVQPVLSSAPHFWTAEATLIAEILFCFAFDLWHHAKLRDANGQWVPWWQVLQVMRYPYD